MIQKIVSVLGCNNKNHFYPKDKSDLKINSNVLQNPLKSHYIEPGVLQNYYISFGSKTKTEDNGSVVFIENTQKKLNDFWAKESTKKEAESYIKKIKGNKLGIKGAIIYPQDATAGSGRKFTAQVIAGETESPYFEINGFDYGTEKVNVYNEKLDTDDAIRKLFLQIKAKAELTKNKSAVLMIENFEQFSLGKDYHKKAMAQLLREMRRAEENGLNILILGSVTNIDELEDNFTKTYKFTDKIEVESPRANVLSREKIIVNAIKEKEVNIAGNRNNKIGLNKFLSEITEDFSFNQIVSFIDKSKAIADESDHKNILKKDFVEAFLQLDMGRISKEIYSKDLKDIVTAHECGHAANLEVMNNLFKKQNISWHIPEKINFITLDPRGWYWGATYYGVNIENSPKTVESVFTDLVSSYGGCSAEKHFFNIDGSSGIVKDIEMATEDAENAVGRMGQGRRFGKKSIDGMAYELSDYSVKAFEKDRDVFLKNSLLVSDLITKAYSDFNLEFTQKYSKLFGTGDCIIMGDNFRNELNTWIKKQNESKIKQLETLDNFILKVIEYTKKGKLFNIKTKTLPAAIREIYRHTKIKV